MEIEGARDGRVSHGAAGGSAVLVARVSCVASNVEAASCAASSDNKLRGCCADQSQSSVQQVAADKAATGCSSLLQDGISNRGAGSQYESTQDASMESCSVGLLSHNMSSSVSACRDLQQIASPRSRARSRDPCT